MLVKNSVKHVQPMKEYEPGSSHQCSICNIEKSLDEIFQEAAQEGTLHE